MFAKRPEDSNYSYLYYTSIILLMVTRAVSADDNAADTRVNVDAKTDEFGGMSAQAKIYIQLFRRQRMVQKEAIKSIVQLPTYEKKHKMLTLVLDQLFKVMNEKRVALTDAGYMPDNDIPQDDSLRDAVSKIAENTAFFGDLVLRLPDLVHSMYDKNNEWNSLIRWGINFCNSTSFIRAENEKLLELMSQELNIVERSPEYENPYTDKYQKEQKLNREAHQEKFPEKKKKKKKRERGPQMSRVEL